jgi:SAM domain (Sterile alpha motif)/Adenylate and Guanylate cyclase catalytic domain
MQQIAEWLEKLGLGQYAQRFAENDIDSSVLPDLTDEDLKKIGVSLGHRKRMLRAIAALHEAALPAEPLWRDEAERRQLTIMFCDLVGSTALSTKLDPEDLQEIIGTFHRCCAKVVTQSGGFVARYLGDGVLAYFGYPEAHEDDAERAVRAGLALVEAVAKLDAGEATSLHVRVGIATGLVVVGDLIRGGHRARKRSGRRDPQSCSALSGARRAGCRRYRERHTPTSWWPVRLPRSRGGLRQGIW